MKKRILAVFLSLCMMVTVLPLQGGAVSESSSAQRADNLGLLLYSSVEDWSKTLTRLNVCEQIAALIRCPLSFSGEDFPFVDCEELTDTQKAVVMAMRENGVTNGTGANTFSPNNTVTRGQMATFIYRAIGAPKVENASSPFNDVDTGAYYESAIANMSAAGIIPASLSGCFYPSDAMKGTDALDWLVAAVVNAGISSSAIGGAMENTSNGDTVRWSYNSAAQTVTISSAILEGSRIFVARYDEGGRFLGMDTVRRTGRVDVSQAKEVQLIWVTIGTYAPICKSETISK